MRPLIPHSTNWRRVPYADRTIFAFQASSHPMPNVTLIYTALSSAFKDDKGLWHYHLSFSCVYVCGDARRNEVIADAAIPQLLKDFGFPGQGAEIEGCSNLVRHFRCPVGS